MTDSPAETPAETALDGPVPETRAGRHALISSILTRSTIRSQADLAEALAERGVRVTQATLSRDLDTLGAAKVRDEDGVASYRLPGDEPSSVTQARREAASEARLRRWCADLLEGGDVAGNIAVLRTPPGAAEMLGSALDQTILPGVLGSVAGDDTIIVVARDTASAKDVLAHLLSLAHQGRHSTHD